MDSLNIGNRHTEIYFLVVMDGCRKQQKKSLTNLILESGRITLCRKSHF